MVTHIFYLRLQYRADNKSLDEILSLPHFCGWCFVVSGVLLYLTAFIHLLCGWNVYSTVSVRNPLSHTHNIMRLQCLFILADVFSSHSLCVWWWCPQP